MRLVLQKEFMVFILAEIFSQQMCKPGDEIIDFIAAQPGGQGICHNWLARQLEKTGK